MENFQLEFGCFLTNICWLGLSSPAKHRPEGLAIKICGKVDDDAILFPILPPVPASETQEKLLDIYQITYQLDWKMLLVKKLKVLYIRTVNLYSFIKFNETFCKIFNVKRRTCNVCK